MDRSRSTPRSSRRGRRDRLGSGDSHFGLVHVFWIGLACLAVAGAMDVISTVLRNTILQEHAITDEFRSRISSIQMAVVTGGPRLGDVESGVVANFSSTEFSIVSGGIACIVGVLVLIRVASDVLAAGQDLTGSSKPLHR